MRFRLRSDLHVSRQVYQHKPVYVVHDPVAFRSHRLSLNQYRVLARLDAEQTAGENYQRLNSGEAGLPFTEETFCQLLMSLARPGLIVIPGTSGSVLFEHHQRSRALQQRSRLLGFLFLQIPLVNPDRFLSRTMPLVSWLFTRTFLMLWLAGMVTAGIILSGRLNELIQPVNGLLAARNLPFLWAAFVVLKIWHELGHGYACRRFGGSVPEMGTILIAGTPAAYVDATNGA